MRTLLGVICVATLTPIAIGADRGQLFWSASIQDSQNLSPGLIGYRVFAPCPELTVTVTLANHTDRTLSVVPQQIANATVVTVTARGATLQTEGRLEELRRSGLPEGMPIADADRLTVEKGAWVEWDVRVFRPDARDFPPGKYLMHVQVAEPSTLRDSEGKPWAGHVNLRTLPLRVRVDTPGTAKEVTEALFLEGSRALRRSDPGAALKAFLRAADRDPTDARLRAAVGLAQYRLGNYRAAVEAYQRALLGPEARSGTATLYLACSYVGLGDDAAAAQVLADGGMTEPYVATQLARCRERAALR